MTRINDQGNLVANPAGHAIGTEGDLLTMHNGAPMWQKGKAAIIYETDAVGGNWQSPLLDMTNLNNAQIYFQTNLETQFVGLGQTFWYWLGSGTNNVQGHTTYVDVPGYHREMLPYGPKFIEISMTREPNDFWSAQFFCPTPTQVWSALMIHRGNKVQFITAGGGHTNEPIKLTVMSW